MPHASHYGAVAQTTAQVTVACGAARELPKPGMGVEEGMVIVGNEMAPAATLAAARSPARVGPGTGGTA